MNATSSRNQRPLLYSTILAKTYSATRYTVIPSNELVHSVKIINWFCSSSTSKMTALLILWIRRVSSRAKVIPRIAQRQGHTLAPLRQSLRSGRSGLISVSLMIAQRSDERSSSIALPCLAFSFLLFGSSHVSWQACHRTDYLRDCSLGLLYWSTCSFNV